MGGHRRRGACRPPRSGRRSRRGRSRQACRRRRRRGRRRGARVRCCSGRRGCRGGGRGPPPGSGLPEDLVMPASNQHIAPALWPARTIPCRQARLRIERDVVRLPDRQQVEQAAAADVDQVLLEQVVAQLHRAAAEAEQGEVGRRRRGARRRPSRSGRSARRCRRWRSAAMQIRGRPPAARRWPAAAVSSQTARSGGREVKSWPPRARMRRTAVAARPEPLRRCDVDPSGGDRGGERLRGRGTGTAPWSPR